MELVDSSSKVGVVVPTRNRIGRTKRFIEQIFSQSHKNFILYVVDSNSTDGTIDWLRSISNRRLVPICATDHDYWAGATNLGVFAALKDGCNYILTINDDSIPSDDLLDCLLTCSENEGWQVLGSRVNFWDDPSMVWSIGSYNVWGSHRIFQLRDNGFHDDQVYEKYHEQSVVPVELMCGNGVLIHRTVFEKIGFYDEKHCPHYHADSEFIMRAAQEGYRVGVCLNAVVYNDTSNYIRQEPILALRSERWPLERLPLFGVFVTRVRGFVTLFFHKRSERRLGTAYYIIRRYAPPQTWRKTFFLYVAHAVYMFILPRLGSFFIRVFGRIRRVIESYCSVRSLFLAFISIARSSVRRMMYRALFRSQKVF